MMNEVVWRIEVLVTKYEAASYGPAHAVFDDGNYDDDFIRAALNRIQGFRPEDYASEHSAEELAATKALLEWMLTIPEKERAKPATTWVLVEGEYAVAQFLAEAEAIAWNEHHSNRFDIEDIPPGYAYFGAPSFENNQKAIYRQWQEKTA